MRTVLRRAAVTAASLATLGTSTFVLAPPAAAVDNYTCRSTTRAVSLPSKPDVNITVKLCASVIYNGKYDTYKSYISTVSWNGTSWYTGGKRFDSICIRTRIEHYNRDGDRSSCMHFTHAINSQESGRYGVFDGYASVTTATHNWTGDATMWVNKDGDGRGGIAYGLTGTKTLY